MIYPGYGERQGYRSLPENCLFETEGAVHDYGGLMTRNICTSMLLLVFLLWGSAAAVHSFNPIYRGPDPVDSLSSISFQDFTDLPEPAAVPETGTEAYQAGLALFFEERFYSAEKAFTESRYDNWEEWASLCQQTKPETGELWHDPDQTDGNTQLTIRVEQGDTDLFARIYQEDNLISNVYIAGSDKVTIKLPGDAVYKIKDGVGRTWYGEKEAFGEEGTYEMLTFDEKGTEEVLLKSGFAYDLRIIVRGSGYPPDPEPEVWESF